MAWWRRLQMPKDERLEALKGRIYREVYILICTICGVSFLYKQVYLGLGWDAVITEAVILLASAVYGTVRSIGLGIVSDEAEIHDRASKWTLDQKSIVVGLVVGLVMAFAFGIRSAAVYGDETTWLKHFLLVFIGSFLFYVPFLAVISILTTHVPRRLSEKVSKRNHK